AGYGRVGKGTVRLSGGEAGIVEKLRALAAQMPSTALRVGIGDDATVLTPPSAAEELIATTDQVIENRHFLRDHHPPGALGRKTLCRGLSDIAAMGGAPRWCLLSLALPEWVSDDWLQQFLLGAF